MVFQNIQIHILKCEYDLIVKRFSFPLVSFSVIIVANDNCYAVLIRHPFEFSKDIAYAENGIIKHKLIELYVFLQKMKYGKD